MNRVMPTRCSVLMVVAVSLVVMGACAGGGGVAPSPSGANDVYTVKPALVTLNAGQTAQLSVTRQRVQGQDVVNTDVTSTSTFTSSAPTVAAVSTGGLVTAVAAGGATILIAVSNANVSASVTVTNDLTRFNGIWKGSISLAALSCAGSQADYGETLTINVNSSGVGTLTATDSPGFDRQYAVTIPSSASFTSQGVFSFGGQQVPGQIAVTIAAGTSNGTTSLTYTETTNWGSCTNTYGGTLTKQ